MGQESEKENQMRIALVTTTINVPHVLKLYRALGPDVHFFIAGDRKSPDTEIVEFLQDIPGHTYYAIDWQYKLGFKTAKAIPENCIQRRNIATLAALQWGADVIVSVDDDNVPLGATYAVGSYFDHIEYAMSSDEYPAPYDGIKSGAPGCWFDVGDLLIPRARHRGFPVGWGVLSCAEPVVNAKIGVVAGICLGNPDIDAYTRMAGQPIVHQVSELLRSGIVVDPATKTVFNSQNTAVLREFIPAWFMWPHVGRYDDIFASLVVQRLMRPRGYHVHFGQPFVWQQRNPHNLLSDLKAELFGMEHVAAFAQWLDDLILPDASVLDQMRHVCKSLFGFKPFPYEAAEAGMAWCDDCAQILSAHSAVGGPGGQADKP